MDINNDELSNSCSFNNVEYVNNPTIIGKIVNVLPLVRKSGIQLNTVVIYHCVDALVDARKKKKFKVLFFAEAADEIWHLNLRINDYIAFQQAVVFKDYSYYRSEPFYSKIVVVESLSELTEHILFKRNESAWLSLPEFLKENKISRSENNEKNEQTDEDRTEEIDISNNDVDTKTKNDSCADVSGIANISSSEWLEIVKRKKPPNNLDSSVQNSVVASPSSVKKTSSTSSNVQKNCKESSSSPSKPNFRKISPGSLMHDVIRCYKNQNIEKNVACSHTSEIDGYYEKLSNLREKTIVNIFGIVVNISEIHPVPRLNKYRVYLTVVDDTNTDGLKILLMINESEELPILQKYCIILIRQLKIIKCRDELMGIVKNSHQVVTFDKDDFETVYKQATDFTLTSDDKKRVELLNNWMLENIPLARPFTPLASVEMKPQNVNFRCQINDLKAFDMNIIVLRISDGTICRVPFHRIPLDCDRWGIALSNVKSIRKPSKEVDVIVHASESHIYKKFVQLLKVGLNIELYNVKLNVMPETVKTKPENSLKACLEGTLDSIIPIQIDKSNSEKKQSKSEQMKTNFEKLRNKKASNNKSLVARIVNKRKLFEHSPRNNLMDSDETDFENDGRSVDALRKKVKLVSEPSNSKLLLQTLKTNSAKVNEASVGLDVTRNINVSVRKNKQSQNCEVSESSRMNRASTEESTSSEIIQRIDTDCTDNQINSISSKNSYDCAINKKIREHLHHSYKTLLISEKSEIQKRMTDYPTKNDVKHYFHQWPLNPGNEAFYIQVTIMSAIPYIDETSTDFETIGLVSGYCNQCDRFSPFYMCKWIVSDEDGPVSICTKCKEKGIMAQMKHELMCELMLNDEFGVSMPAIVMSHHAENFFGCTVSQLCFSTEAKIRVRAFMDTHIFAKGKEKKPLIVKVIRIYCPQSEAYKYHVLS